MRRIAIVSALVLVPASLGAGAASAAFDMMSPTGNPGNICVQQPGGAGPTSDPGVCRTDNRNWTWYMDSSGEFKLETADREATRAGMKQWNRNTDINASYDSTPTFGGAGETDVIYQEGLVPAFPVSGGITWCQDKVNGTNWKCDQHYIRIRGAGTYSKRLVMHEAGHALGLTHGPEAKPAKGGNASIMGIMRTGSLPNTLGATPKAQVNSTY